jgi:hypothetical protein
MNGLAKDGFPNLSIIDYGIGITKDGIGSLNQNSSTT